MGSSASTQVVSLWVAQQRSVSRSQPGVLGCSGLGGDSLGQSGLCERTGHAGGENSLGERQIEQGANAHQRGEQPRRAASA